MSIKGEAPAKTQASVPLPKGVTAKLGGRELTVKGPKGTLTRVLPVDALGLKVDATQIEMTLRLPPRRKQSKALLNTWEAHCKNMVVGVTKGFEARLKSVAAHFPMKLQVKGDHLLIENFLGEKFPRTAAIPPGVQATVDGEFVKLEGIDIERVGIAAATIERTTHIREYDPRVFQDGIYIVDKAHPVEA
jgi:large subunit ribosomal protein L6